MLKQNPYKNNFGSIKYNLKDITKVELGIEKYDAVTGWSSFHHIPNVKAFIQKVYKALKKDGLIATMDDMPQSRLERSISYFFEFILPTYNLSYIEKVKKIINIMFKKENLRKEIFSPMEKAKHTSVYEIHEIIKKKFHIIHYNEKNAFSGTPVMRISGPDIIRYFFARIVIFLDRLLCNLGLVNGFERIIIAKKEVIKKH